MGASEDPCECVRLVRPNILSLVPYTTERSEFEDTSHRLLADLNEMGFGPSIASESWPKGQSRQDLELSREILSRYPGMGVELKEAYCDFRNRKNGAAINPSNICFSAGLDDLIDLIIRCLCRPGYDRITICPPVYHMYQTSATVNDVATVTVPLDEQNDFQLRLAGLQQTLCTDQSIKLCFVCSPGNPTGHAISIKDIKAILDNPAWRGIVIVDEAYIDFSPTSTSCISLVNHYPRLIVLQTLSKAFGLASIRVGFAVTCTHLCEILNKVRKPYAVSGMSIALAKAALMQPSLSVLDEKLEVVCAERSRLARELGRIEGIGSIRGGLECNFVLFEVLGISSRAGRPCNTTALWLLEALRDSASIFVRYKGHEYGCEGCIRVTVGNEAENQRFLEEVRLLFHRLHSTQLPCIRHDSLTGSGALRKTIGTAAGASGNFCLVKTNGVVQ